jgi:hypothetical protein
LYLRYKFNRNAGILLSGNAKRGDAGRKKSIVELQRTQQFYSSLPDIIKTADANSANLV